MNVSSTLCRRAIVLALTFTGVSVGWCADKLSPNQIKANAFVRKALQAELVGDAAARRDALNEAIKADPDCKIAHAYLGRLPTKEGWHSIEEIQAGTSGRSYRAAYERMRNEYGGSIAGELKLARWCRGRRPEASRLHYTRLLNIPDAAPGIRAEAIRRLGLKPMGGELVTAKEASRRAAAYKAAKLRWSKWDPILKRWQHTVSKARRMTDEVRQEMDEVKDEVIVSVIESWAGSARSGFASALVKMTSRFKSHQSTRALAAFAIFSSDPSARAEAITALKGRGFHEFVPLLMSTLEAPVEFQFKVVRMGDGSVRYFQDTYQEGALGNRRHLASRRAMPVLSFQPTVDPRQTSGRRWSASVAPDRNKLKTDQRDIEDKFREVAERREKEIKKANRERERRNRLVFAALEGATGADVDTSAKAWWDWWTGYNELYYEKETRTTSDDASIRYGYYRMGLHYRAHSCFARGTPVVAESGAKAIELIQPGDRVLAQNPQTGELDWKTVYATTIRPPARILRISLSGNHIDTTAGHPFWVVGKGWRMAKHLRAGDRLHSVAGGVPIDGIDDLPEQKAYNLIVDEYNNYFVGEARVLAHDNTIRKPTRATVPGLLPE